MLFGFMYVSSHTWLCAHITQTCITNCVDSVELFVSEPTLSYDFKNLECKPQRIVLDLKF